MNAPQLFRRTIRGVQYLYEGQTQKRDANCVLSPEEEEDDIFFPFTTLVQVHFASEPRSLGLSKDEIRSAEGKRKARPGIGLI